MNCEKITKQATRKRNAMLLLSVFPVRGLFVTEALGSLVPGRAGAHIEQDRSLKQADGWWVLGQSTKALAKLVQVGGHYTSSSC